MVIGDLFCDVFKGDGVMRLLDGIDGISFVLQSMHGVQGVLIVLPTDTLFGTECGLVDLLVRRAATDTAQHDALDTHGVGGTENGTYVMLAADIIEHDDQRQFVRLAVLVHVHATHFGSGKFLAHSLNGKCTCSTCASSSISNMKSSCSGIIRSSVRIASVLIVVSSTAPMTPTVPSSESSMV